MDFLLTVKFIIKFVTIGILPGILITCIIFFQRTRNWQQSNRILLLLLPFPISFVITSLFAEILAILNQFSYKNLILLECIVLVLLGYYIFLKWREMQFLSFREYFKPNLDWIMLPAVFLFLFNTVYPFDFLFSTTDCGVYIASGIHLIKHGSFYDIEDGLVNADEKFKELFYEVSKQKMFTDYGKLCTGFFIRDLKKGLISPRYFTLFSIWLGLFFGMGSLKFAMMFTAPYIGLLALLTIYMTSRELLGKIPAILTAYLMSCHLFSVWFSRYLTTEMSMVAPLFLGFTLFFYGFSDEKGSNLCVFVAGLAIGCTHFARIDSILILIGLSVFLFLYFSFNLTIRTLNALIAAYLLTTSLAIYQALTLCLPYTLETFYHVHSNASMFLKLAITAFGGSILIVLVLRKFRRQILCFLISRKQILINTFLIISGLAIIYGYFVRPEIFPLDFLKYEAASKFERAQIFNQMTLRWLGWYFSPPGLFLAFAGVLWMIVNKWNLKNSLFFIISSIFCIYLLHHQHCTPVHYWGMRRFVPVVYPTLQMGLGWIFYQLYFNIFNSQRRRRLRPLVIITFISLLSFFAWDLRLIHRFNHWQGAIRAVERIQNAIPLNAKIIICRYPGIYFYNALRFIFDRDIYMFRFTNPTEEQNSRKRSVIKDLISKGETVYLLTENPDNEEGEGLKMQEIFHDEPLFPLLKDSYLGKPVKTSRHGFSYAICRAYIQDN